ncbi:MAG TPA: response regulator [Gaiellaceae bacterium]|nr:response regulator [Gaiellaceae bacterium]
MRTAAAPARTSPSLRHRPGRPQAARNQPAPGSWRLRKLPGRRPGGDPGGQRRDAGVLRVLVVDDEAPIRTVCRVNLEAAGMEIVEAADGAEALARIREATPALILLDAMMPGVDGWSVAEQLGADPETRNLPIVFVSARAGREDRERARGLGAVGYVTKPFDPLVLAERVQDVLERIARGERQQLCDEVVEER